MGLALAYRDRLGLHEVYLADLDAIAGAPPNLELVRRLPMNVWVDAGVRDAEDAARLLNAGASVVVAGLETLRGPDALEDLIARFGPNRVAFSLDLRNGRPLIADNKDWSDDPLEIAATAVGCGVSRMIVLDLGRVGSGNGIGTLGLIAEIRRTQPSVEIIAGGGVAGPSDLRAMGDAGVWGVLVGSSLHDGRIRREDFDRPSIG